MTILRRHEPTLSIRVVWPLVRLIGTHADALAVLDTLGLRLSELGDRDTRVSCRAAMNALTHAIAVFDEPSLGLRGGSLSEQGDLDVLESAARATANLGQAIGVMSRYLRILHDGAEITLVIEEDLAHWRYTPTVEHHPAAVDFAIACSLAFARRYMTFYTPPAEVWVTHDGSSYADVYDRYLQAPVRFNAPYNGIVLPRVGLQIPMRGPNPLEAAAFAAQAEKVYGALPQQSGLEGRVRKHLITQLATGSASMQETARNLGMGVATLRRKLDDEGAAFKDILDDVRETASQRYLLDTGTTVSEVAFLLGFSDVRAFGRAFKRWTGMSPTEYREHHRRQPPKRHPRSPGCDVPG